MKDNIDQEATPVVWSIAGSDPSGGAGIQADLKTMNSLGVFACSVITSLTIQNSLGVEHIEYVKPQLLRAQLQVLFKDMKPKVVKIGVLGNSETIQIILEFVKELKALQCNVDTQYALTAHISASGGPIASLGRNPPLAYNTIGPLRVPPSASKSTSYIYTIEPI